MKKLFMFVNRAMVVASVWVAMLMVNTTCSRRYFQEDISEQLEQLRKY